MGTNDTKEEKLARRKVNTEVRYGKRPHPNTLPCAKCGHVWKEGERRHEYDHPLDLKDEANWTVVESLCTTCHHGETNARIVEEKFAAVLAKPTRLGPSDGRIEFLPLSELRANPRNPKDHDIGELVSSIKRFGFVDAVVIDERTGMLVSGHGRVEALKAMRKSEPQWFPAGVRKHDDEWMVPVQRGWSSADDAEAEAFIIAANRIGEVGGWDDPKLEAVLSELASLGQLAGTGYDADDVDAMLAAANASDFSGLTDPDDVPQQPEPIARLGDVFQLGRHRLMCGDSTDAASVEKLLDGAKPHLMVTDPPYGVEYDASWRNDAVQAGASVRAAPSGRAIGKVENDDNADWRGAWVLFPGEVAYVWHAGTKTHIVAGSLIAVGFQLRAMIVWAKSNFAIGRGHYHEQKEPLWYAVRSGGSGHWQGSRSESTLWTIDKPAKSETGHSTQKPVECMRRPMLNNSQPGDAVYEPFSGSGTTIIAAEETGRVCFAMELNPAYVDLAVARWEAFTGKRAEKL